MIVQSVATGYTDNFTDDDNTYSAFEQDNIIDGGATDYVCPKEKVFFSGKASLRLNIDMD